MAETIEIHETDTSPVMTMTFLQSARRRVIIMESHCHVADGVTREILKPVESVQGSGYSDTLAAMRTSYLR